VRNPGRFVTRSTLAVSRPTRHSIVPTSVPSSGDVTAHSELTAASAAVPTAAQGRAGFASAVARASAAVRGELRRAIATRATVATGGRILAVLATVLVAILGTTATAFADDGAVQVETASAAFGMLGPVGLVAVGFGIIGMAFGVVRQRRKARAKAAEAAVAGAGADEQPTRPLESLQHP
jgi:hypothetical protein